jgi:hypothetical protein
MYLQLVTIETDFGDSISESSLVLKTPVPLTVNDYISLNYAFGINLPDEMYDVDIQPLEDAITLIDPAMKILIILAEKANGKICVKTHEIPLIDFNTDTFSSLVQIDEPLHMAHSREIFSDNSSFDNYVFGANLNSLRENSRSTQGIDKSFFEKHGINQLISTSRICHFEQDGDSAQANMVIYPEQKLLLERVSITKRKPNAPEKSTSRPFDFHNFEVHNTVKLYNFEGDLIDTLSYIKGIVG